MTSGVTKGHMVECPLPVRKNGRLYVHYGICSKQGRISVPYIPSLKWALISGTYREPEVGTEANVLSAISSFNPAAASGAVVIQTSVGIHCKSVWPTWRF